MDKAFTLIGFLGYLALRRPLGRVVCRLGDWLLCMASDDPTAGRMNPSTPLERVPWILVSGCRRPCLCLIDMI